MEVKLLADGYQKNEQLFKDFMNGTIDTNSEYYSNETVYLDFAPDLPIYMGRGSEKEKVSGFNEAIKTIMDYYIHTNRDIHMSGRFWHSLMMTKRDYLLELYGERIQTFKAFINIILKPFDWECYIYKCVLAAEYIYDAHLDTQEAIDYHIHLIISNIDMYNYILKDPLFRNSHFILNYFKAIDELGITHLMKSKIKDRDDLGKDERYGRRVFQELNNNYPVIMAPFLQVDELKEEIIRALSNYVSNDRIEELTREQSKTS